MFLTFFLAISPAKAEINQSSFFDWDYAVWVWKNVKTGDAYDAEWAKYRQPAKDWMKRYKANSAKALEELQNNPKADLIKKGHDLSLVYNWWASFYKQRGGSNIWMVYEPNCYEGSDTYALGSADNGYRVDDKWSRWNIFTGKCDWPDWRMPAQVSYDKKQKSDFMAHLEKRREFITEQRRKQGL
ncbi:MAG: hypothetical protein HWE30_17830 [Methylocystaceae bacterium]|nr:hypothetical protein [Methylocystaceae bacterium]